MCRSIKGDAERLSCYDNAVEADTKDKSKAGMKGGAKSVVDVVPYAQIELRSNLEKALLKDGVDAELYIDTGALVVWTWLSRATVYHLITEGKVLDQAKAVGFRSVRFWDKGSEGMWTYALTGDIIPHCDIANRLCH
jgi:hypothetical protein